MAGTPAVLLGFSVLKSWVLVTMGDRFSGKLGVGVAWKSLEDFVIRGHSNGSPPETLATHPPENFLAHRCLFHGDWVEGLSPKLSRPGIKAAPCHVKTPWKKVLVTQSCLSLCDPMDCSPLGSSVQRICQARILVDCHSFLQGIFPTRVLSLGLLHCRQSPYAMSHQESPRAQWSWSKDSASSETQFAHL